jgi:subtilase family serine protease
VQSAGRRSLLLLSTALLVLFALAGPVGAQPGGGALSTRATVRDACASVGPGFARCFAKVVTPVTAAGEVSPLATTPIGYTPADLQSAYKLSTAGGTGQTIAIVDAFDDPNAESDLAQYRAQFGLPPCTTANGCFRKVNQNGGTAPPPSDVGWAEEISLDVDMVSAICPNCHILLVEATSNSFANLAAAVDRAALMGAQAISNSYGGGEIGSSSTEVHYNHPGHAITASSGDSGFGVEFPASSPHVTAVGGTTLNRSTNARGWAETAWSGAGSGCSRVYAKPSWQHDTGCARRTVADVSAVADPATGVAVFDTFGVTGGPWFRFGGTSVSAPIIASVYGLAGNGASVNFGSFPYAHTGSLFDVVGGSNARHCNPTYLCTAVAGYDGPTGLGTPNGSGAF